MMLFSTLQACAINAFTDFNVVTNLEKMYLDSSNSELQIVHKDFKKWPFSLTCNNNHGHLFAEYWLQ